MKDLLTFLWEYKFIIVILVSIILFAFLEWEKFKSIVYVLMLQAKRLAKDAVLSSGKEQEEWVVKKLYTLLPKTITRNISDKLMHKIVHIFYIKAMDYIDDGEFNNSIK
ncbi:hypothetical protein SH2C18_39670 [Clostridium sediminicola]|uniref:hypothetical protein n=1 Tax=Clostridium sediminicola TaxID=3114879 RepID=UPI0031F2066F